MATIIGQHQVAELTQPINGSSPIDANTVRGNDNTVRSAYVDHDNDTGIHVQSSALASRPSAGTAGRKWITADAGAYTLWYDDGAVWHEVGNSTIEIEVLADANLVAGDVVKVTGYSNGQACPTVNKVSSAADLAFGVVDAPISLNTKGYIINTGIVRDVNTNAFTVGTVLYPSTSGGFTSTKPTSGSYQVSAYVLRQNTNNGVLFVEFSGARIVESSSNTANTVVLRDGSGNFTAGAVTTTGLTVNGSASLRTGTFAGVPATPGSGEQRLIIGNNDSAAFSGPRILDMTDAAASGSSASIDLAGNGRVQWTELGTGSVPYWRVWSNSDTNAIEMYVSAYSGGTLVDHPVRIVRAAGGAATWTRYNIFPAATTSIPSVRLPHGTAPTSATNGDVWTETNGLFARINGTNINYNDGVPLLMDAQSTAVDYSAFAGLTYATVSSVSIPNIAVGNIIEVEATGVFVNNSGSAQTTNLNVRIGSTDVIGLRPLANSISSSPNERGFTYKATIVVQSTALVLASDVSSHMTSGIGSADFGGANFGQYTNRTTSNITGTQTLLFRVSSNATSSAGTQTFLASKVIVRRYIGA